MALKFFVVPVRQSAPAEDELNAFMHSQRVLVVDRKFVDLGDNSFWSICIDYLPAHPGEAASDIGKKGRIDYREVLAPDEFAMFTKLRDLRKQLAQAESVPVYAIFTNDQLAEMVRGRVGTKSDMERIAGVGDGRIGKYADKFLAVLNDETSRKPV